MKIGVKDKVREAIEPTVSALGYRIWDVTYQKLGADYHLEITIDSDDGITIDDCEKVHRAIDPILDEYDFIEGFFKKRNHFTFISVVLICSNNIVFRLLVQNLNHFKNCRRLLLKIRIYKCYIFTLRLL